MNAELFDGYTKYPEAMLRDFGIPNEHVRFLTEVGLPEWCAPNMHFGELGEPWVLLPTIEFGKKQYLGLGDDRDERAVALSLDGYSVWVLPDQESEPIFLSRDVMELSQALHIFQACINSAVDNDAKAFTDNRIPPSYMEPFMSWANANNPSVIRVGSFWQNTLFWLGLPNTSFQGTLRD